MSNIPYHPTNFHKYSNEDLEPVQIKSVANLSSLELSMLQKRYCEAGFVIFEINNEEPTEESLLLLSKQIGLGDPYVPHIYHKTQLYLSSGLNLIHNNNNIKTIEKTHRAFSTNNEQLLHSDGTLEKIGFINTSILLCVNPAVEGGHTTLFNSVAAFTSHYINNPHNMIPLLDNKALTRTAVNMSGKPYTGPAFQLKEDSLTSRFSIDNTSNWELGFNLVNGLKEAYNTICRSIHPGSPFYLDISLKRKQGIIMANDKIAHGRTTYSDSKRLVIRGLFNRSIKC
ncbi:TauD/TfdA family dioxygenase [Brevibacillus sp. DP1.3A]|uniref:TauD/TfdA family dioxygenase n=1 Tax=Brevibacillus sp. DP1.3A TaxID=2738867 RepID=UPI00156B8F00|nr:TauD/TfdA family dioxygenase [Brevibacillus sp. DP1.3A]UED72218.1 TauD/TfdA family dioxygenase [Brevibacillus sp. DP1.3A]